MEIKKIISQSRRDYTAIMVCEHCGHEQEDSGYDDSNYHNNVIPKIKCNHCGKIASDNYHPLETKYPDGMII